MEKGYIRTSKSVQIGSMKMQNKFPPIIFNLFYEAYEIETYEGSLEYTYKSHGMWFAILGAILPLIFKSIPFNWLAGLGIGFAAGMVFNLLSWLVFKLRMKIIVYILKRSDC